MGVLGTATIVMPKFSLVSGHLAQSICYEYLPLRTQTIKTNIQALQHQCAAESITFSQRLCIIIVILQRIVKDKDQTAKACIMPTRDIIFLLDGGPMICLLWLLQLGLPWWIQTGTR